MRWSVIFLMVAAGAALIDVARGVTRYDGVSLVAVLFLVAALAMLAAEKVLGRDHRR
jgi:hypothetical protein